MLGQYRGVCRDELLGGLDSNQLYTAVRENGINIITYRRTLISCKPAYYRLLNAIVTWKSLRLCSRAADPGDRDFPTDRPAYVVWALGRLDRTNYEPSFHDVYQRNDVMLELSRKEPENTCMDFTEINRKFTQRCVWIPLRLLRLLCRAALFFIHSPTAPRNNQRHPPQERSYCDENTASCKEPGHSVFGNGTAVARCARPVLVSLNTDAHDERFIPGSLSKPCFLACRSPRYCSSSWKLIASQQSSEILALLPATYRVYSNAGITIQYSVLCCSLCCTNGTLFSAFREPWQKAEIFDRSVRTFKATIGPSGGKRGYEGITGMKSLVVPSISTVVLSRT